MKKRKTTKPSWVKDFLQAQDVSVGVAVEKHVNGKIRKIDEKLDAYILLDNEWKEKDKATNKDGYRWAIVLWLVCSLLSVLLAASYVLNQPGRWVYRCSDFSSYEEAKKKFLAGASYLDRGGVDNVPCESLLNLR